ncbi:hypothetical protein F4802DRAFT_584697 [Xylaria palmicola]|nr:hypothetical protein F4802DRAFT_584697 [Xylaria palmicola]
MNFSRLILTFFLGLVAASPTNHTELGALKTMFHEIGIIDPITFKLVDRLVELATTQPEDWDVTNVTEQAHDATVNTLAPRYAIPKGEIRCHKDKQLDYMSVMAAVGEYTHRPPQGANVLLDRRMPEQTDAVAPAAPLAQKCADRKMKPHESWYGSDYWKTTRVYVCNWGGANNCNLNQILEAVAEIWARCGGAVGGWWRTNKWKKGYGIDGYEKTWCDFK